MKIHLGMNNLSQAKIRQTSIGLVFGLISVVAISQFMGSQPHYDYDISFDSEIIALNPSPSSVEKTKDEEAQDDLVSHTDFEKKAHSYPLFAKYKAELNDKQKQAIANTKPIVSLVINDIGQQSSMVNMIAEKIPNDVTVALSPYILNHHDVAKKLHDYGFETWMDVSTMILDVHADKGGLALSPVYNFEKNLSLLLSQLESKGYIAGVVIPNQSLITETAALWEDIAFELFAEGYGVLDNTSDIIKPALYFHDDKRAPYIKGDHHIDELIKIDDLNTILNSVRMQTLEQGKSVITISELTPRTLDILVQWVNSLDKEGITLVPLSAQAKL